MPITYLMNQHAQDAVDNEAKFKDQNTARADEDE